MKYEDICINIVRTLNARNVPKNRLDRYVLECLFEDVWKIRPTIYHYGGKCTEKPFGSVYYVRAGEGEEDTELAYKKLVEDYLRKEYDFKEDFDTYEEMMPKLAIRGIDFKEGEV